MFKLEFVIVKVEVPLIVVVLSIFRVDALERLTELVSAIENVPKLISKVEADRVIVPPNDTARVPPFTSKMLDEVSEVDDPPLIW